MADTKHPKDNSDENHLITNGIRANERVIPVHFEELFVVVFLG